MEPVDPPPICHPVVTCLVRLDEEVSRVADVPLVTLDAAGTAVTIRQLGRLQARLAAVSLAVLAHGDDVDMAGPSGAASLADDKHRCVQAALAAGRVRVDQARVIVAAVDKLPTTGDFAVSAEVIEKAEAHLVGRAADHDATDLRRLGLRLLAVVSPETADAYEAAQLAAEEARAAESTRLTMSEDGHGSVFIRAKLPAAQAAMLKKMLLAYAAPKHQSAVAAAAGVPIPARTPSPQRMGRAFCGLIESLADKDLPEMGGTGATVVVTLDLDTLLGATKAARLDTGESISPGQARRLACLAGIVPAVLDGDSIPLDLGRTRRFHTRAQRIAIALRDGGCTGQGCDWPPGMCHIHHGWLLRSREGRAASRSTRLGARAASPTSPTPACCAPTTPEPTTLGTTAPPIPPGRSASTGAREDHESPARR